MIEKDINNIKINHEELKRCNAILEENWNDSSSEQFKNTYLGPIDAACATFVGESFVHAQELNRNLQELEELRLRYSHLTRELQDICSHPSWNGCGIGIVEGHDELNQQLRCTEFFVIPKEKMPYLNEEEVMFRLASLQVTSLDEFINPHFYAPL